MLVDKKTDKILGVHIMCNAAGEMVCPTPAHLSLLHLNTSAPYTWTS